MSAAPHATLRIADLDRSVSFYVNMLGCELQHRRDDEDIAIVAWDSYSILLAGPEAYGLSEHLNPIGEIARTGATIYFNGGLADMLGELRDILETRGAQGIELIERPWGDRTLSVRDPDGYTVAFWTTVKRTPEETLALYEAAPDALEGALAGLTGEQQLLRKTVGEWSIREIVHHLVDADAAVLFRTKLGLAEPGRTITGNPYQQDRWADGLAYAERDIAPSVLLFRAIHVHIVQLMRTLPDAWTRHTLSPEGTRMESGSMLNMLVSHAYEHIEVIREIRIVGLEPGRRSHDAVTVFAGTPISVR